MIIMQLEILLLILSALLFAPEIAARIVKYYRAAIAWRDCVDDSKAYEYMDAMNQALKKDGENAKLYMYSQGTTSPADTYVNASLTKPLDNPVVLDSRPKVKRYAVSPVDAVDIKKGKRYEILEESKHAFYMLDDVGFMLGCCTKGSGHIYGQDWQIIEEPVTDYELVGTDFVKREKPDNDKSRDDDFVEASIELNDQKAQKAEANAAQRQTAPIKKLPKDAKVYEYGKPKLPKIPRGFKRHDGKKKPKGITKNTKLDLIYHHNGTQHNASGYHQDFLWEHSFPISGGDIIAYRLSKRKVG